LLARGPLALALLGVLGCSSDLTVPVDLGAPDGAPPADANSPWAGRDVAPPYAADGAAVEETEPVDGASFNCPEQPTAYVFERSDPYTGTVGDATALLTAAGFAVQPLPLDVDPRTLRGLIYLGSFVSETQEYQDWAARWPTQIYTFVDAANVLVQMTQADQTELRPPFLPNSQTARRTDTDVGALAVLDPAHPLLAGVAVDADGNLAWKSGRVGWETFGGQTGFEIVLAASKAGDSAALMEGAYSQGRFILTAMALDKPEGVGPDRDAFNQAFFHNLLGYVRDVCRRQPHVVAVTPSLSDSVFGKGAFTLALLPDTQYYSLSYPGIYLSQVSWIVANVQRLRIPYVFHLGDVVDQNTPLEWSRASKAMWLLEGIVPYTITTGNHDLGPGGGAATRDTLLNHYFSYERTASWPTFGGAYEPGKLENTYHLFSAGGRDYIVLSLEWGPRDEVVQWADHVMDENPHRYGILVTHAYLNWNDKRYDHNDTVNPQDFNPYQYGTAGGVNDGEQLWQKLVRKHAFVMTVNGHVLGDGTGYLASVTDKGNICHQMLSNYQFRNLGGEGYMRLLEFEEDAKTVKVYTYSPLYDSFLVEPDQSYTIVLDVPVGPAP
jgi:3',5'-cyclic AMP phosphodiesterase CpdA